MAAAAALDAAASVSIGVVVYGLQADQRVAVAHDPIDQLFDLGLQLGDLSAQRVVLIEHRMKRIVHFGDELLGVRGRVHGPTIAHTGVRALSGFRVLAPPAGAWL
jgi:hypothetical protein